MKYDLLSDIYDEIDIMGGIADEYLSHLKGDQTEEAMYEEIADWVRGSYITAPEDIVDYMYYLVHSDEHKQDDILDGIFDFNGMMGYYDDEEIEEETYNQALGYFTETKNNVLDNFSKFNAHA